MDRVRARVKDKRVLALVRASYFRHAVCKQTLQSLENFAWHRVTAWQMKLHRWNWKDVRRRHTGPTAGGSGRTRTSTEAATSQPLDTLNHSQGPPILALFAWSAQYSRS